MHGEKFFVGAVLNDATSHTEIEAGWQEDWQATVQAAKREGQLTIYVSGYGATLDAGHFQKDFPEIKLVTVTGQSGQLGPRILAERRAGKYLADISSAGANPNYQLLYASKMLEPISSALILPEVTDLSKWWGGKHWYIDPEGQYIFVYVGNVTGTGAYAVNAVNPAEFKSYWDFLNPKWKGEIVARDVRIAGPGGDNMRFFYHHPELGPKFIHRLFSEMDLTLTRDFRQGIDWLGQGKFPLAIFFSGSDVKAAARQGLPVIDNSPYRFRHPEPFKKRAPSQRRQSFHQLVSLPKGADRAAEGQDQGRRRTGLSQDRHPEGRRRTQQPKVRRGELYDGLSL